MKRNLRTGNTQQHHGSRSRARRRRGAHWMVMGALAASAAMAGRPAEARATHEGPIGRSRQDTAAVATVRRVEWPEFQGAAAARVVADPWVRAIVVPQVMLNRTAGGETPDTAQAPQTFTLDIPPGPLGTVIAALEQVTGLRIIIADEGIRSLNSPGVSGQRTAEQALEQVLTGTGVTATFTDGRTASLQLQGRTESVEVTARARTVSSPKYTEPIRDIPQTITVIPRAIMDQQGADTLRDVLRNVSGITFQAGEGGVPAGDNLTIRGFSARTDMFIDGVRDPGGYARDSFNLESVEVTKGPSSSIAGRGSTGGAINQVSKAPNLNAAYGGAIGGGNADYRRTTLDVNQPLQNLGWGDAAVRLNVMWTDQGVPGRNEVESQRWGVAPSISFGLGTPTRLTASFVHLSQDNLPEYGIPWVPENTNPELAQYSNGIPPVSQDNFYGLRNRDYEDTSTNIATVQLDHDFSSTLNLRNITRYGTNDRDSVITAPRFASVNTSTLINRQLQSRDMEDDIVANQTTVTARLRTGELEHAVATGLEFTRETSENFARTGPTAPQTDLFNPNPNDPYPGPITRSGARTYGTANTASLFAFDTVSIGQWEFSGGGRVDRFAAESEATAVTGEVTPFERTDTAASWRAGAVYKPATTSSIYLGYGTSFNPSAEGLSLSATTVLLEPERSRTLEVGTKWDVMQERLSATGAYFRTTKTNARTPGVNPGDPPTVLAGEQIVNGVELGLSGRLSSRWTALATAAFMRSEIEASNTPDEIDNALALTPERTFSLWTTYDLPIRLTIGGGVQYMDSVFRNVNNVATVPSYWLVNSVVSYAVNEHLSLRFNGNNLADERYVDRVGGGHYIPGAGRSAIVSLAVKY